MGTRTGIVAFKALGNFGDGPCHGVLGQIMHLSDEVLYSCSDEPGQCASHGHEALETLERPNGDPDLDVSVPSATRYGAVWIEQALNSCNVPHVYPPVRQQTG